jgi:hypothetical protein
MIDNPKPSIVNVGLGLFPPLMGTFDYPPPPDDVKLISAALDQPRVDVFQVSSFRTTYFHDLWTPLSPSSLMEETGHLGMAMPLSATEFLYSII